MKPIETWSTEPGVLAVAYPFPERTPLVEVVDAERVTTAEIFVPRRHGVPCSDGDYDAALAGLGYSRTSTWRLCGPLAFCDVTTAQPIPTR